MKSKYEEQKYIDDILEIVNKNFFQLFNVENILIKAIADASERTLSLKKKSYVPLNKKMMGYRCIGIDTRGFGDSDRPYEGYDYNRLSDDVRCVVEALNLRDFTLAGHSTGGAIAIRYMARHKGYGVSKLVLISAAAPSLIRRKDFPYGINREVVVKIIQGTYSDRPKMLRDFGEIFFFKYISEPFSQWFASLGMQAAGWATAAIANTWLGEEKLFSDLETIRTPTLILHGVHDKVVLFELAEIQNQSIKGSKLVPFRYSGHGVFYDEKGKFNEEIMKFIEE